MAAADEVDETVATDAVLEATTLLPADATEDVAGAADEATETDEAGVELAPDDPLAELQTTALGTVTPCVVQNCLAKVTADCWSAWSQAFARQQAILLRKSALLHMHFASRLPQPPIELPLVN